MIKRIILTTNYSPWSEYSGGGQRSTHYIASHLAKMNYDVHVVFTRTWLEKITIPNSVPYKIHWASFPGISSSRKNTFRFLSSFKVKHLVKSLITNNCVVHSNGEEGAFIRELKKEHSFKFVVTPRYPLIPVKVKHIYPTFINAFLKPAFSKYILLNKTLKEADIICPTSSFSKNMYKNFFNLHEKQFSVVYNGVEESFFKVKLHENLNKKIIFFGRLSHSKGIDTLLKAAEKSHSYFDELVFIGRGELEELIKTKSTHGVLKGKIKLINWLQTKDLIQEIASSSIAVLPSREESFGNSIAESMACGIPVITSNIGSIPEIIEHPSQGILLDPEDIEGFSDAIIRLLSSPKERSEISEKGRMRVESTFKWEKTLQHLLNVYTKA